MEWIRDKRWVNRIYYTSKKFNGFQYNVIITVEEGSKTLKYWVAVSSGKKRKDFEVFEDKGSKSLGGIKALFWCREAIYDFPKFYSNYVDGRKEFICIGWADARRRDVYSRLEKEGFIFMNERGNKILMKNL